MYQTDRVYLQDITYVLNVPFFSSPEPKAEVKLAFLIALYLFSVVNVVFVVINSSTPRATGTILVNLVINHLLEDLCLFK